MTIGKRLVGKIIMITGAAQGMGRQASIEFAQQGAIVYASDLQPIILESLGTEIIDAPGKIYSQVLDVTDYRSVKNYVENLNSIDVLFNCAGYVHQGTIFECELKDWQDAFVLTLIQCSTRSQQFYPRCWNVKKGRSLTWPQFVVQLGVYPIASPMEQAKLQWLASQSRLLQIS